MKIWVLKDIKSDFPFIEDVGTVKEGIHEAHFNKNGAISCISDKGKLIGIRLNEFKFLSADDRERWINMAYPDIPKVGCPPETDALCLKGHPIKLNPDGSHNCKICNDAEAMGLNLDNYAKSPTQR